MQKQEIDWVKGIPYTMFNLELPCVYAIHLTIRQHQSGKISIHQAISKHVGVLLPNLKFKTIRKDPFDTSMMDKLNKLLLEERVV